MANQKSAIASAAILEMVMDGRMPFNEEQFVNAMSVVDGLLLFAESHYAKMLPESTVTISEDLSADPIE